MTSRIQLGQVWRWNGTRKAPMYTVGKEYMVLSVHPGHFNIEDDNGAEANNGAGHWWGEDDSFFSCFDFVGGPVDIKAEIADEAKRIVTGARRSAYGTPENNFERIARFWQAYFENRGLLLRDENGVPHTLNAADVSPMMRLMKEARLCETPDHRDSFVDLVGYTLTGAEVNGVKPLTADKSSA